MFVNFEKPCFEQDLQRRIDNPASRKHSHDIASKKNVEISILKFLCDLIENQPCNSPLPPSPCISKSSIYFISQCTTNFF